MAKPLSPEILNALDRLPALPASTARVIAMLSDGTADLKAVGEIVRCDEALSMAVMRHANSVRYGRPGKEFSLQESIVRLGGKTLTQIVLQQQVASLLEGGGVAFGLQRGALWRGALAGAFAAQDLAQKHRFADPQLCFLCGLLRDVGQLALDVCYGADYERAVLDHLQPSMAFVEAERSVFGEDHAAVGAELALHWHLPTCIADAIRYHHQPPAEPPEHDDLFDIVHAADVICLWGGLAIGSDGLKYRLAPHVRTSLALTRRVAEAEIALMWGRVHEVEQAMAIRAGGRQSA